MTYAHRIILAVLIVGVCVTTAIYTAAAQEPTAPTLPGDTPETAEPETPAAPATETPTTAPAADAVVGPVPNWVDNDPTPLESAQADPIGTVGQLVADVRAGDWRHAAALVLVLLMLGLRKLTGKHGDGRSASQSWWPAASNFFRGDRGGAVLVGLLALGGALATAIPTDAPLDWRLFAGALVAAWTAVGAFTWFKRIWSPKDKTENG